MIILILMISVRVTVDSRAAVPTRTSEGGPGTGRRGWWAVLLSWTPQPSWVTQCSNHKDHEGVMLARAGLLEP